MSRNARRSRLIMLLAVIVGGLLWAPGGPATSGALGGAGGCQGGRPGGPARDRRAEVDRVPGRQARRR